MYPEIYFRDAYASLLLCTALDDCDQCRPTDPDSLTMRTVSQAKARGHPRCANAALWRLLNDKKRYNICREAFRACETDDVESLDMMLFTLLVDPNTRHVHTDRTLLMHACEYGSIACVQRLLQDGACDIKMRDDREGKNVLMLASAAGKVECVKALLKTPKCPLHKIDNAGRNALMHGLYGGNLSVCKILTDAGEKWRYSESGAEHLSYCFHKMTMQKNYEAMTVCLGIRQNYIDKMQREELPWRCEDFMRYPKSAPWEGKKDVSLADVGSIMMDPIVAFLINKWHQMIREEITKTALICLRRHLPRDVCEEIMKKTSVFC